MVRTVYILLRIKIDRMKNVTDPPVQYFTPCFTLGHIRVSA